MAIKKVVRKKASKIYFAVICKEVPETFDVFLSSRQRYGDWACFIGRKRQAVINKAIQTRQQWSINFGPYEIYVGVLSTKVEEMARYTEAKIA